MVRLTIDNQLLESDPERVHLEAAVQSAFEALLGLKGSWTVTLRHPYFTSGLSVKIDGPNAFHRWVNFEGPEEQNSTTVFHRVRAALRDALR